MVLKRKNPGEKYARRALRKRANHDPSQKKRILLISLGTLVIIALALVWGNILKAESDQRRAEEEANAWLVDEDSVIPIPVDVPNHSAGYAQPGGKMHMSDILDYGAVTFDLGSTASPLPYHVELPEGSGMSIREGAPSLQSEVARFHKADLYVIGVFTVTSPGMADTTEKVLRQGQELALLTQFAEAGIDNILLLGIPAGSDALDKVATGYLVNVKTALASFSPTPAVGMALYPSALEGSVAHPDGTSAYVGQMTPGRMLAACDYLALDLRQSGEQTEVLLKELQYAYLRYELRLLTSTETAHITQTAVDHGFSRIFEFGK